MGSQFFQKLILRRRFSLINNMNSEKIISYCICSVNLVRVLKLFLEKK